jgi:hypothetical protein
MSDPGNKSAATPIGSGDRASPPPTSENITRSKLSLNAVPATKTFDLRGAALVRPADLISLNSIMREIEDIAYELEADEARQSLQSGSRKLSSAEIDARIEGMNEQIRKYAKAKWHVSLSDQTDLGPMTLEEVLLLPNTRNRRISSLKVSNSGAAKLHVEVKFRRGSFWSAFTYTIQGQSALVEHYARKLADFAETVRPIWSFLYLPYVSFVPVIVLSLIAGGIAGRHWGDSIWPALLTILVVSFVGLFVVEFLFYAIGRLIFPKCSFAIGKEEHDLALLERVRWGLLIAAGISLVTSWVVSLL